MRANASRARSQAKKAPRLSLRAFAPRLGVSEQAISKGIRAGRLVRSIGWTVKGRPYIAQPDLALQEWAAGATKAPTNGKGHTKAQESLVDVQLLVGKHRARQLELQNRQREGTLVDAAHVRRESFECARTVRNAILAVPDRIAAELAAETDAAKVHARLEEELRLALEALAEKLAYADDPGSPRTGGSDGR